METSKKLREWLHDNKVKQVELARLCDMNRSNFHRIIRGDALPSLKAAYIIHKRTRGRIKMADWVSDGS